MFRSNQVGSNPIGMLLIGLALGCGNALHAAEGILDGMVFVGQTGEQGGPPEEQDTLSFNDGQLYSSDCARWEFSAGEYETLREDGKIRFRSIIRSPTHGEILWQGAVEGKVATATYTWTKERWWWTDVNKHYWFKGKVQE
jgi:hypothetical protein